MAALALVSREAERPLVRVLLPGRDVPIVVCHPRGAWEVCDGCLLAIARALAEEMAYSLEEAVNRPTACFHAELGGEANCSLRRAEELHLRTQSICWQRTRESGDEAEAMLYASLEEQVSRRAAVVEMPQPKLRSTNSWRRRAVAIGVVAAFVALLVFRVVER